MGNWYSAGTTSGGYRNALDENMTTGNATLRKQRKDAIKKHHLLSDLVRVLCSMEFINININSCTNSLSRKQLKIMT